MNHAEHFKERIRTRNATVGIVGLGYVGLPLALRFAEAGLAVLGFDVDPDKITAIEESRSYISHIPDARIRNAEEKLSATTDFTRIGDVDAIIICVPTPLGKHRDPDLSFVIDTVDSILPYLRAGQVVSLESTTYPGTSDEEIVPRIRSRGFTIGQDYFVVYSPEREDPGRTDNTTQTIPKVLGGATSLCRDVGAALYEVAVDRVVLVSSMRAAEMTKILENVHRAVNIGLANEMKLIADRMDLDIHEIIQAAATKPFGFVPYYPGPGLGGHCIPIDPFYLTWKAREYGMNTRFIELAGEINRAIPEWVVEKTLRGLNEQGKPVKGSRVLVLGLAYKKNVGDTRESPSVEIMDLLRERGAELSYSDPYVPVFPKMREHHYDLQSVKITPESLAFYDAVVIATDHDAFDYKVLLENSSLIVDTRGRYMGPYANVVRA